MNGKEKRPARCARRGRAVLLCCVAACFALAAAGALALLVAGTTPVENRFQPSSVTCEVEETFDGTVKSDVRVQNTGDVDAYIRVALVTYAQNAAGQVDAAQAAALPAFAPGDGWVLYGGYYYYTLPVPAGGTTATALIDRVSLSPGQVVEVLASAIQSAPARAVGEAWGVSVQPGSVTAYEAE